MKNLVKGCRRFYSTVQIEQKLFLKNHKDNFVSFWQHPEPTVDDFASVNCIVEIPSTFSKKYVIKTEPYHPIMQDTRHLAPDKDDLSLRFYQQSVLFNYGFIPQTYESPIKRDERAVEYFGDNDPVDIVEVSPLLSFLGIYTDCKATKKKQEFVPFKARVLGSFCLIDQEETDWKVILLEETQAKQLGIWDFKDLQRLAPGYLKYILHFFKYSKIMEGKEMNRIEFDEKIFGVEESREILRDFHREYHCFLKDQTYADLRKQFLVADF